MGRKSGRSGALGAPLLHFAVIASALAAGVRAGADPVLERVAQVAERAVDVDWSDTTPATPVLYQVERAPGVAGPWTALVAPGDRDDTRRFTDAGLPTENGIFLYRISALYDGNPTPVVSNVLSVALDPACEGFCIALGLDRDGDGTPDASDNCVALANDQSDADGDGNGDACDVPADYDDFVAVAAGDAADFLAKVQATPDQPTHLYLPPGSYVFDQTIEIRRTAPLLVHGAGRLESQLTAASGVNPLFRIADAPAASAGTHIQLSNLRLRNPGGGGNPEAGIVGLSLETSLAVHLDVTEVYFEAVGVELRGAGFTRLQTATLATKNALEQAVLVDHPEADLFMVGGGMGGGGGAPLPGLDRSQISLLRQKAGRVRVYTSSNGGTRGPADFWIESPSPFGPHVIGDVRSEGPNAAGYRCDDPDGPDSEFLTGKLLRVPPTDERVDVVVKGALAAWSNRRVNCPHTADLWDFVEYSSPGRLWLVGNAMGISTEYFVAGSARGAHVLSAGNQGFGPIHSRVDVGGTGSLVSVGDFGAFNHWCKEAEGQSKVGQSPCIDGPTHRFYVPDGAGGYAADYTYVYDPSDPGVTPPDHFETVGKPMLEVPRDDIPSPLGRPRVLAALPGMIDVKAVHGAVGDGATDDTAAIQAALVGDGIGGNPDSALLYFPAGTYCITSTLYWNHQNLTDTGVPYGNSDEFEGNDGGQVLRGGSGGFWAGAGSNATILRFDTDCDGTADEGSLFASQKMAYHTVQGMTFETAPYDGTGDSKTFHVENYHRQCFSTDPDWPACPPRGSEPARDRYDADNPFGGPPNSGIAYHDMVFRGGAHAYAMAIETHTNNAEILWESCEFSDAGSGLTINNANALNDVVYHGRFLGDDVSVQRGGQSDFSIIRAEVDGGVCPYHSGGNPYIYGLDDTGGAGCSSYSEALGTSTNVPLLSLIESSTLSPAAPGPQLARNRNGAAVFLHTQVTGPLGVDLGTDSRTVESILGLHTTHPDWVLATPLDATNFQSDLQSPLPEAGAGTALAGGALLVMLLARRRNYPRGNGRRARRP